MISYIGIGSNQQDPVKQAKQAIKAIDSQAGIKLIKCSALYCSAPMGPQDQPDYINAVVAIETTLNAQSLLEVLQSIEQNQGRVRKDNRWGPRTLDLDILLYNNQEIKTEHLIIPHYGMHEREFVLYPLFEIAPNLTLPNGTHLSHLITLCDKNGLTILSE